MCFVDLTCTAGLKMINVSTERQVGCRGIQTLQYCTGIYDFYHGRKDTQTASTSFLSLSSNAVHHYTDSLQGVIFF